MTTIVLRSVKGALLTHDEVDANFRNLNDDKVEEGSITASEVANVPAGDISATDVQAAVNELDTEKAPLASPALTGTPTAPTASIGTNTTQLATTAFVEAAAATTITVADESSDTTSFPVFVTAATGDLPPKSGTNLTFNSLTGDLSATLIAGITSANLLDKTATETITSTWTLPSPSLTGIPTAPTAAIGTDTTQLATTAFVEAAAAPVGSAANGSLIISSGAITVTSKLIITTYVVGTEGAAATDDLDTINGGEDGQTIVFRSTSSSQDTTFKDNVDNLRLAGDFTLTNAQDTITLIKDAALWFEVSRSNNA